MPDDQTPSAAPSSHQAPPGLPLSPEGLARRDEIFRAMSRASAARRTRRAVLKASAACLLVGVVLVASWPTRSTSVPSPQPFAGTVKQTAPPSTPDQSPSRVVAVFAPSSAGTADRLAAAVPASRVLAQVLNEVELEEVLAEGGAYGFARIQGRVYVLNNHPLAAEAVPGTR